jgi:IS30 family transposase
MPSVLSQSVVANILELRRTGISIREISRRLGVHRETVGKYLRRLESHCPDGDRGSDVIELQNSSGYTKRNGPLSQCEPFRELILERVNQGLSAQKIFQYLVSEKGFKARYYSVRRFVAKLLAEQRQSSKVTNFSASSQTNL